MYLVYDKTIGSAGGSSPLVQELLHVGTGHNQTWINQGGPPAIFDPNTLFIGAQLDAIGSGGSPTFEIQWDPGDPPLDSDGFPIPDIPAGTPFTDSP